ncbi:MAG: type III polyketide synthase [Deltaproteobacteria bacterium]
MPAWIHRIATAVPDFSFSQEEAGVKMQEWARSDRERRLIRAVYRSSGIERRHAVVDNFDRGNAGSFFRPGPDGELLEPGTAARNALFALHARPLAVRTARQALAGCDGIGPEDVTHVVTVSCTGFYNPGPDYEIVRDLGMSPDTQRYHLGFMGCYAAFPALRMAAQFCEADPGAVVLVLCLELCSLHVHLDGTEDMILANSLFADGAAAAVVSGREPEAGRSGYRIDRFRSTLVPDGEGDMAWRIGDRGFDISLSSYVPKIIGANLREFVEPSLADAGVSLEELGRFAVHSGGKSILDQVQRSLGLDPEQLRPSREVLRKYGNMSSPSVLFVLEKILRQPSPAGVEPVCALAFGPGLTVEMALLSALPVPSPAGAGS